MVPLPQLPGNGPWPVWVKTSLSVALQLRKLVSDFSIILAILIFCAIDAALGLETPKLLVPSELKVTDRWGSRGTTKEQLAQQQASCWLRGWAEPSGQGMLWLI